MKAIIFLAIILTLTFAAPLTTTSNFTASLLALPPSQCDANPDDVQVTDFLLFEVDMEAFQEARNKRVPEWLDWASDGCTDALDHPFGWNFLPACQRHDFGYRNFQRQGRFTEEHKRAIDEHFYSDMMNECVKHNFISAGFCESAAIYYEGAVQLFGGKKKVKECNSV